MLFRWSGFADLVFAESAWLAFARAAELAETDVHEQHQDAWVIDDRHLSFSLETESNRASIDGIKRFLGLLALQAREGEAAIEVAEPRERWLCPAASPSSAEELGVSLDIPPQSQTIRAAFKMSERAWNDGGPLPGRADPAGPEAPLPESSARPSAQAERGPREKKNPRATG